MNYKFKLENEYKEPNVRIPLSIFASLMAGIQGFMIMLVALTVCVSISIFVTKLWFINPIFIFLACVVIVDIYSRNLVYWKVGSPKTFKIASIFTFLFFVLLLPILFVLNISSLGADIASSNDILISQIKLFDINALTEAIKKSREVNFGSVKFAVKPFFTMLFFLGLIAFVVWKILLIGKNLVYLKSENRYADPRFEFTLYDTNNKQKLYDLNYLNGLKIDYSDLLHVNRVYFDIYAYGEYEEQYFHIERYATYEKNGKLCQTNSIHSSIYAFDINKFSQFNDVEMLELDETLENQVTEEMMSVLTNHELVPVDTENQDQHTIAFESLESDEKLTATNISDLDMAVTNVVEKPKTIDNQELESTTDSIEDIDSNLIDESNNEDVKEEVLNEDLEDALIEASLSNDSNNLDTDSIVINQEDVIDVVEVEQPVNNNSDEEKIDKTTIRDLMNSDKK